MAVITTTNPIFVSVARKRFQWIDEVFENCIEETNDMVCFLIVK